MGNNRNCDMCSGNDRNQMDMHRHKAAMYERYAREQMMPRSKPGCDSCGNARVTTGCDTCGNARTQKPCDECEKDGRRKHDELYGMPLAMGYVPWHEFECTYEPMEGLRAGTIFPELDKPFYGKRGYR